MSVSVMKRLTLIAPKDSADALLRRLMRLRSLSLTKVSCESFEPPLMPYDGGDAAAKAAERAAQVDAAAALLSARVRQKGRHRVVPVDLEEYYALGKYERAWKTVHETERILKGMEELRERLAAEQAAMRALLPYLSFPYPLGHKGTSTVCFLRGALPAAVKPARITEALGELGFDYERLSENNTTVYIAGLCHRDEADEVLRALTALGFVSAEFADTNGTAAALFDAAERRAERAEHTLSRLDGQLSVLAENLKDVEILSDVEHTTRLAEENKKMMAFTDSAAILTGWCPEEAEEGIIKVAERFSAAYTFSLPEAGDEAPILRGSVLSGTPLLGKWFEQRERRFCPIAPATRYSEEILREETERVR